MISNTRVIGTKFLERPLLRHLITIATLIILVSILSACAKIQLVADYDASIAQDIVKVEKLVDTFYGEMLEAKSNEREYAKYSKKYVEIDVELRSLLKRNKVRPLNEHSTRICEITLQLWEKYQNEHKEDNTISDGMIKLNRSAFDDLFFAMSQSEAATKIINQNK